MLPPPCQGGMSSSSSRLPYSTPMPVGPKILWPENTKKSASSALHVHAHVRDRLRAVDQRARAGAVRHRDHLPHRRDRAQRVRHLRERDELRAVVRAACWYSSSSTWPRSSTGITRSCRARLRRHSCCQGTMLAWCSRWETMISSPAPTLLPRPSSWRPVDGFGGAAHEDDLFGRRRRR